MDIKPCFEVPMVIPFRDRLGYLKELLHWVGNGKTLINKVFIFDMDSQYPKAVKYLLELDGYGVIGEDRVKVEVVRCNNGGSRSLFNELKVKYEFDKKIWPGQRFVLSDPDVLPPTIDHKSYLVMKMHAVLDRYPQVQKVGCALRIDDLPDHYPQKQNVINWETRFWQNEFELGLYEADVATTFCMVRDRTKLDKQGNGKSLRLGHPFIASHSPWYENPESLPGDVEHYYEHAPLRRWGTTGPGVSWSPKEGPKR